MLEHLHPLPICTASFSAWLMWELSLLVIKTASDAVATYAWAERYINKAIGKHLVPNYSLMQINILPLYMPY